MDDVMLWLIAGLVVAMLGLIGTTTAAILLLVRERPPAQPRRRRSSYVSRVS